MAKHFDQYCPVAHALSLVGERWAFLIVRELLHGPRRYTDLADGLPGIATNVLAARLRDLEAAGVVRKRRLPPPAPAYTARPGRPTRAQATHILRRRASRPGRPANY